MNRKRKSIVDKTVIKAIVFFMAFVAVAVLLLNINGILSLFDNPESSLPTDIDDYSDGRTVYINGKAYTPKDSITSFLIMCLDAEGEITDSGSYKNTVQNDFLMLFVMDNHNKSYSIVQINRDTMTDVRVLDVLGKDAGSTYEQIALAHTYGNGLDESCKNTVDAVSKLLYGVHIPNYAAFTMSALKPINDYFGGVDVLVEDDMTAVDSLLVKGQTVHLVGDTALNYVRARGGLEDSTNISRMSRHRTYVNAIMEKAKQYEDTSGIVNDVFDKISPYMISDVNMNDMKKISKHLGDYTFNGIITPEGESVTGEKYMEFYADDESLKNIVTELFYTPVQK